MNEEKALDQAENSHGTASRGSKTPRGTRGVYSAIFDCLDDLCSRMARLENHAMNHTYSPEINEPPYDRSALEDLEELESATDEE